MRRKKAKDNMLLQKTVGTEHVDKEEDNTHYNSRQRRPPPENFPIKFLFHANSFLLHVDRSLGDIFDGNIASGQGADDLSFVHDDQSGVMRQMHQVDQFIVVAGDHDHG